MIFENSSSKVIFRRNIRNSTKWSLKCGSRFLQAAALKILTSTSLRHILPLRPQRLRTCVHLQKVAVVVAFLVTSQEHSKSLIYNHFVIIMFFWSYLDFFKGHWPGKVHILSLRCYNNNNNNSTYTVRSLQLIQLSYVRFFKFKVKLILSVFSHCQVCGFLLDLDF